MAGSNVFGFLLLGIFLSEFVTENHLTEAKRSRLYRIKRRPVPVIDGSGAIIEGNCPPAPSAAHTKSSCGEDDFTKTCDIRCDDGYVFPGQTRHFKFSVTCDKSGSVWEFASGDKAAVPDCKPVCPVGCKNGGTCAAPDVCTCPPGWQGKECGKAVTIQCDRIQEKNFTLIQVSDLKRANDTTSRNSGMFATGSELGATATAQCKPGHFFPGGLSRLTYECVRGSGQGAAVWHLTPGQGDNLPIGAMPPACIKAECDPDFCKNGGTCVGKNKCKCPAGFREPQCEFSEKDCNCPPSPEGGSMKQTLEEDGQVTVCEFACNGDRVISGPTRFTCKRAGEWKPLANEFPTCPPITTTAEPTTTTSFPPPITPTVPDKSSDGFCYSFCQSSYRTFDHKKYEFNGKCRYVLAKECIDMSFEIQVINDKLCDEGSDCRRSVIIKSLSTTIFLEHTNGKIVLSDERNSLSLPCTVQNMEINEVGDMVEVTNNLGFVLRWDMKQFISVEITKDSLKGKMCGLCGDYDGYSTNDFGASILQIKRTTAMAFGIDNKVPGNEGCDDGSVSSYCADNKRADAAQYCENLRNGNFSACAGIVDVEDFKTSCIESVCRYGDAGSKDSACCAFEALVRECVRQGGKGAGSWRTADFCPANCPAGQIYDDCGPNCVKTCNNRKSGCTSTECVEGCRCPDDKVLHKGQCIDATSCPCMDGGEEYEEGSSRKYECNTCTCKSGIWECTNKSCDASCEGWGDPHYKTFDGKHYDFMGDCRYYLVKSTDITIIVENRICAKFSKRNPLSCTKNIRVIVGATDITLLVGKAIKVGSGQPHMVPEFRNADVFYHSAGSVWDQLDVLNFGVTVLWDGNMAFKVLFPATFIGKTKGLCGTYNRKEKDDFLTPEGDIETSAARFGFKWRTEDCDGKPPKPTKCKEPALSEAKTTCNILKSSVFEKCHAVVDWNPDYKNCIVDHCFCGEAEKTKCICSDLRRYADDCESKGHGVGDWRKHVPECAITCDPGKVFKRCVENCKDTCREISVGTEGCKDICTEGCTCPDGKVENNEGQCIPIAECGCHYHGKDFAKGDKNVQKDKYGRPVKCLCVGPNWSCKEPENCDDKPHEKLVPCLNKKCEEKCGTLKEELVCTEPDDCEPGCECADNYVRNSKGECVLVENCECVHGGQTYPPGGSYKEDCNICTCNSGKWDCVECACIGTCTAWGDSHYTTFDGKKYEFTGNCEYTLATLREGVARKNNFHITVKNVPCGSSGVTCAKTVTLAVLDKDKWEKVVLTRDSSIKSFSKKIFEVRDVGKYKYINVRYNGISLLWDKGTILHVKLDGDYRNMVEGLCGDFNGDSADDFHPRNGGSPIAEAHKFAKEWSVNDKCEAPSPDKPTQCANNEMELYAKKKCGVMRGPLFMDCRGLVDPEPYYERCVHDTCACDFGGDCECLCTAISVFARECANAGKPVRWRSQELCPIQCPCRPENASSECPCYNPCIPITPQPNCMNPYLSGKPQKNCSQVADECVEGCFMACPDGFILDKPDGKCIPKNQCGEDCEDPCCVTLDLSTGRECDAKQYICLKDENGDLVKKCFIDGSTRKSSKISANFKGQDEKIVEELGICRTGLITGYEDVGNNQPHVMLNL